MRNLPVPPWPLTMAGMRTRPVSIAMAAVNVGCEYSRTAARTLAGISPQKVREYTHPTFTPVWEPTSTKRCFVYLLSPRSRPRIRETEIRGGEFPKRNLGTRI